MRGVNDDISNPGAVYTFTRGSFTAAPTISPTDPPTISPTVDTGVPLTVSTVGFYVKNDTNRGNVVNDLITEFNTQFPDTSEYKVVERVISEETGTVTWEVFQEVGNDTLVEEKIRQVRCGDAVDDCTLVIEYGRRILLSGRGLLSNLVMDITFDLSSDLISSVNGLDLDDPTFEQALANALGITNTPDIVVTSNGGDITVTATLEALPSNDPWGDDLIDTSQGLLTNLTSITNTLLDSLNGDVTQLLTTTIDLCPYPRDCNGRGSCNDDTGVCACVGNWWGINCETECTCINGGECVKALCQCEFPYYGLRCDSTSVVCQTC